VSLTTIEHGTGAAERRWSTRSVAAVFLLAGVLAACTDSRCVVGPERDGTVRVTAERHLMGTRFRIDVITTDVEAGEQAVEAAFSEIERAEGLLSNWDEHSQISDVNRSAGVQPVTVSNELMAVLQRAFEVAELTGGAFDITFASCGGLWSIRDRKVPTEEEIAACLPHVDYRQVALDPERSAVYIADPDMRLGIAGLAKGYRVDRAAEVLESRGVTDYVVDGGGDMRVSTGALDAGWPIQVAHPRRETPLGVVKIASGAIATSGDYEWYFEQNGVRYHHILDPATGRPAWRCLSATVIAASAVEADALATGLFVLGPDDGLELAERTPGVEAMLVGPDLTVRTTAGFPPLTVLGEAGP
jgi:thiamine biosynthesis lipoprotein